MNHAKGLGHGGGVVIGGGVGIKGQHGRHTLGHTAGLQNDDALLGDQTLGHLGLNDGGGLVGHHDDVLVVGQDEDLAAAGLADGVQQVIGGGIHGLAARDDLMDTQLAEDVGCPLAQADGHEAEVLVGGVVHGRIDLALVGLLAGRGQSGVLLLHVLDLDHLQSAVLDGLGQHHTGIVGVDMHLDDLLVVHEDHAVAQGGDELLEGLGGTLTAEAVGLAHDALGAVGEGDGIGVELTEVGALIGFVIGALHGGHVVALQGSQHALEHGDKALSAGIHHVGLLQDGEHLGSLLQHLLGTLQQALEEGLGVALELLGLGLGDLGGATHDGQDGALGGLADGAVGLVGAAADGLGDILGIGGLQALEGLGHTAEEQGQDRARVTSCGAKQTVGHAGGGLGQGAGLHLDLAGGLHGQGHIDARVAVGDGEYVQVVDLGLFGVQGIRGGGHHFLELLAINDFLRHNFQTKPFIIIFGCISGVCLTVGGNSPRNQSRSATSSTRRSVFSQPRQGSVMDLPKPSSETLREPSSR